MDVKYKTEKCRMVVNKEFNLNRYQIVKVKWVVEEYEIKNRLRRNIIMKFIIEYESDRA